MSATTPAANAPKTNAVDTAVTVVAATNIPVASQVAKTVAVANEALKSGDHRTTGEWSSEDSHRTHSEWLSQGNHRSPAEWFAGEPSRNKDSEKKTEDSE